MIRVLRPVAPLLVGRVVLPDEDDVEGNRERRRELVDLAAIEDKTPEEVGRYEELPTDVDALHRLCNPDEGRFVDRSRKFAWNDQGEAVLRDLAELHGSELAACLLEYREIAKLKERYKNDPRALNQKQF